MRRLLSIAAVSAALACGSAQAQQVAVKIGVLTDMSSLYADIGGPGSVAAAKMAIADFTALPVGRSLEVAQGIKLAGRDAAIAGQIASNLRLGRTFAHALALEKRIAELTPEDVKAAFGKYIDPKKLVIIRAGDFKK